MADFSKVLNLLGKKGSGFKIKFNEGNVADGDNFLNLSYWKEIECEFTRGLGGIWWVSFDGDDSMPLENCPESFFGSILKNA